MTRPSDITTATQVPNGMQVLDFYEGPKSWSLAEAFAEVRKTAKGAARLYRADDAFEEKLTDALLAGLRALDSGESLTLGQVVALWYTARCNEIDAAWMADEDMTYQAYKTRLAGARKQVTWK